MANFAIVEAYEAVPMHTENAPLHVFGDNKIRTVRNIRHSVTRRQVIIEFEDGSCAAVPSSSYLLVENDASSP